MPEHDPEENLQADITLNLARQADRVLAFDFGLRRIGVAVGNRLLGSATPITVLSNSSKGPNWDQCDSLLREWKPGALVVGYPINLQGNEQAITVFARQFSQQLFARYELPVVVHDERFTSRMASAQFTAARQNGTKRRKDAAMLDAVAAQIILESWFSNDNKTTN